VLYGTGKEMVSLMKSGANSLSLKKSSFIGSIVYLCEMRSTTGPSNKRVTSSACMCCDSD
jgi:hypothetical protein